MGYNITLVEPETGETIQFKDKHNIAGGTYKVGGTNEAWLNITYNYAKHFSRVLGNKGIRAIYGMTGKESMPLLKNAISQLGDDVSADYWEATEGNTKKALQGLLTFAQVRPDGIWSGD